MDGIEGRRPYGDEGEGGGYGESDGGGGYFDRRLTNEDFVDPPRRSSWDEASHDTRPLYGGRPVRDPYDRGGGYRRASDEAWAAARPPMVLILAGDDQGRTAYRAELEAMIAANGLEDAVRIVGEVADMPAAYLAAEVICTPSLEAESFGRTAVEAQMMGRPVWASDLGASRETVDPAVGGDLVSPGDVAAWTVALQRIAQTPTAELRAMGERAGERARRLYAFDAMVAATFAVYRRAVDRAAS